MKCEVCDKQGVERRGDPCVPMLGQAIACRAAGHDVRPVEVKP